jgi:REP element-mobilizing transposase RayT
MSRLPRFDRPGAWFHVMNRGVARRVVFPDATHVRAFLARLAMAVRRGEIEVHAFCVMATHFHLLVRSPRGNLAEALRRVQNEYVRWYNRRARRDGALFRGRYRSRPVLSEHYKVVLVRYIEGNPIHARIVQRAEDWPHGSASRQARLRRPRWLATWWVDELLARLRCTDPETTYASLWGRGSRGAEQTLVEARVRRPAAVGDDLDDLVGAAPDRVQDWMERKARLADGGRARPPLVDAPTVDRILARARSAEGAWVRQPRRGPPCDLWSVAHIGLLSDLGGMTHDEIAQRLRITTTLVGRQRTRHRGLLREPLYAARLAQVGWECLAHAHPVTDLTRCLAALGPGGSGDSRAPACPARRAGKTC